MQKTVLNCFNNAGFVKEIENEIEPDKEQDSSIESDNEMQYKENGEIFEITQSSNKLKFWRFQYI